MTVLAPDNFADPTVVRDWILDIQETLEAEDIDIYDLIGTKADNADLQELALIVQEFDGFEAVEAFALTKLDVTVFEAFETAMADALALKADASTMTTALAAKADAATTTNSLALKADLTALALKADITALALKADSTDLVSGLATKADAAATTTALAAKADSSTMTTALAAKADAAATTASLALKADASTTTAALAAKADASTTTTALAGKASLAYAAPYLQFQVVGGFNAYVGQATNGFGIGVRSQGHGGWGDSLILIPLYLPTAITVDQIGFYIHVAGAAGKVARLGIYTHDASTPTTYTRLLDAGTVAVDSTGNKTISISQAIPAGWCSMAYTSNGGPEVNLVTAANGPMQGTWGHVGGARVETDTTSATGGLPASRSLSDWHISAIPAVYLRRSA